MHFRTLAVGWLAAMGGIAHGAVLQAGAAAVNIGVTDHFIFSSEQDAFDPEAGPASVFLHEAEILTEYDRLSVGVRLSNSLLQDTQDPRYQPVNLEKKLARVRLGDWNLAFGDTHQEFGRGIALALYSDPAFGLDNTLEGVSVTYRPGGFEFGAFAGRVNALRAPVAINPVANPVRDRTVWMAGAAMQGSLSSQFKLGGHYLLAYNQPDGQTAFDRRWHTVGATFSKSGLRDGLSLYAESNALFTTRFGRTIEEMPTGFASYASVDYFPVPWRFRAEVKDYRDYRFEFRRPPTLEEDVVETLNTQDVTSTRLTVERVFPEAGAKVRGSYVVGDDRIKQSIYHHAAMASEFGGPARSKFTLGGGYRWMPQKMNMSHGDLMGKVPTFRAQYLELGFRKQLENTNLDFLPTQVDRNILSATYNFSPTFNVSLGYEYVPTNPEDAGRHFANAGAALKMGAFAGKAFVGQTSGGTQCSGGICRQVPPYTGAMLESSYRF